MGIRVYIVEDHPDLRRSLAEYLRLREGFELCGVAESAEEALEDLPEANPSVVLVDLTLPGRGGLALLREVRRKWQLPCIVLSSHWERTHIGQAFEAGACGYILKGEPEEVVRAILMVARGDRYISEALLDPADPLAEEPCPQVLDGDDAFDEPDALESSGARGGASV